MMLQHLWPLKARLSECSQDQRSTLLIWVGKQAPVTLGKQSRAKSQRRNNNRREHSGQIVLGGKE